MDKKLADFLTSCIRSIVLNCQDIWSLILHALCSFNQGYGYCSQVSDVAPESLVTYLFIYLEEEHKLPSPKYFGCMTLNF